MNYVEFIVKCNGRRLKKSRKKQTEDIDQTKRKREALEKIREVRENILENEENEENLQDDEEHIQVR